MCRAPPVALTLSMRRRRPGLPSGESSTLLPSSTWPSTSSGYAGTQAILTAGAAIIHPSQGMRPGSIDLQKKVRLSPQVVKTIHIYSSPLLQLHTHAGGEWQRGPSGQHSGPPLDPHHTECLQVCVYLCLIPRMSIHPVDDSLCIYLDQGFEVFNRTLK